MARAIVKTLTTTRVSFNTIVVEDGVPSFVTRPDAVFSGQLDKEKVERQLKARLGKDTMIVITKIDAGQHRYEMSMEEFVLNAHIVDDSEDEADEVENEDGQMDEQTEGAAEDNPEPPVESQPEAAPAEPEETEDGPASPAPFVDPDEDETNVPF